LRCVKKARNGSAQLAVGHNGSVYLALMGRKMPRSARASQRTVAQPGARAENSLKDPQNLWLTSETGRTVASTQGFCLKGVFGVDLAQFPCGQCALCHLGSQPGRY
jgi:hypothetical protein